MVSAILGEPLIVLVTTLPPHPAESPTSQSAGFSAILRHVTDRRTSRSASLAPPTIKLASPECRKIAQLCSLYQTALGTLTQLRLDILTGILVENMENANFYFPIL